MNKKLSLYKLERGEKRKGHLTAKREKKRRGKKKKKWAWQCFGFDFYFDRLPLSLSRFLSLWFFFEYGKQFGFCKFCCCCCSSSSSCDCCLSFWFDFGPLMWCWKKRVWLNRHNKLQKDLRLVSSSNLHPFRGVNG